MTHVTQSERAAEMVHPATLKAWLKNPRKNDGEPVERVAASIKRFGFAAPIVARLETREIIAGHTRWKAALKLGLTTVPVRFVDLPEREAHLLALADNRLGELAEWDTPELHAILASYDPGEQVTAGWSDKDMRELEHALGNDGEDKQEGVGPDKTRCVTCGRFLPTDKPPKRKRVLDQAPANDNGNGRTPRPS